MRVRRIIAITLGIIILTGYLAIRIGGAQLASATAPTGSQTIGSGVIHLAQPTDPQLGKLTPTTTATTRGMFGPQIDWPIVPIHLVLARNGHLISYGTPYHNGTTQGGLVFDSWDPAAGTDPDAHIDSDSMGYDSFCNSLVTLDDGRLLMVGGNSTMSTMLYDPTTGTSVTGHDLNRQRWYATTLKLTTGKILVLGGSDYYDQAKTPVAKSGTMPEIGTGTGTWTTLPGAYNTKAFGTAGAHWFYPRAFNGPNGTVVGFSGRQVWMLDPHGSGSVKLTATLPYDPGPSTSQVMYAPGKILIASGGSHGPVDHVQAKSTALTIDYTPTGKPVIKKTGSVRYPGNWLNLTILPTGTVFANGGTKVGTKAGATNSDTTAETWQPTTGTWLRAATAKRTRTYHSVSLLMPSGAIYTGGSGAAPYTDGAGTGPENNMNAELYYPAYFFTTHKDGSIHWADRPTIASIRGQATYGGSIQLGITGKTNATKITTASLISLPSVTHSQNTDQRRVPLTINHHGTTITATLPKSVNTLPPGDYELTVTNSKGVPSPAQIITIRRGQPGLVTPAGQPNPTLPTPTPSATMADMSGME